MECVFQEVDNDYSYYEVRRNDDNWYFINATQWSGTNTNWRLYEVHISDWMTLLRPIECVNLIEDPVNPTGILLKLLIKQDNYRNSELYCRSVLNMFSRNPCLNIIDKI